MKKLTILLVSYAVVSIFFIGFAVKANENRLQFNAEGGYGYAGAGQESRMNLNDYKEGGEFSTEKATYEVRLSSTANFYTAYSNYNGNEVSLHRSGDQMYSTMKYPNGAALTVSTSPKSQYAGNAIIYEDVYNGNYCTIYVDDNLEQVDDVDVEECYELFSMEDVKYLYDESINIFNNY